MLPIGVDMRPQSGAPPADNAIHRLAASQHGVMARRQLLAAGVDAQAVKRRLRAGRLVRIHPGVYAAGHSELTVDGHWMAAVLACGPGAALTHRAATAAYALRPAWRHWLEVSVTNDIRVPGILIHRVKSLDEVTTLRGIPITTVARTLTDLADVTSPRILQQVLDQAEILRLDAPVEVKNGRRGAGSLKQALAGINPLPHMPRSELERRFLDLCNARPAMGLVIEGYETDFAWPEARAHRRARRLGHPPHAAGVPAGPKERRGPDQSGLDRAPLHLPRRRPRSGLRDLDPRPATTLTRSCGRSTYTTWGGTG